MATEELTVVTANRTGAGQGIETVTTADGFKFPNDGRTFLVIENDVAGNKVMAFKTYITIDGKAVPDAAATVISGEAWIVGPFPPQFYNNLDGFVECTIDVDLLTVYGVAAISIPD